MADSGDKRIIYVWKFLFRIRNVSGKAPAFTLCLHLCAILKIIENINDIPGAKNIALTKMCMGVRRQATLPNCWRTAARTRDTRERTVPTGIARYSAACS